MKWIDLVKLLAPIVISAIPNKHVQQLGPVIVAGIGEAQQIPGASGAEKKAHVIAMTNLGAAGINAAAGKEVVNPAETAAAASQVIDTIVGVTNLVHGATTAAAEVTDAGPNA